MRLGKLFRRLEIKDFLIFNSGIPFTPLLLTTRLWQEASPDYDY